MRDILYREENDRDSERKKNRVLLEIKAEMEKEEYT